MSEPKTRDANSIPDHAAGIEAIKALAVKAAKAEIIEFDTGNLGDGSLPKKIPVVLSPDGRESSLAITLAAYRTRPQRIKGTAKTETLQSFIALTTRHQTAHSAIFAQTKYPHVELATIVNYFGNTSDPDFADHRIVYSFPLTDQFKAWVAKDSISMGQAEFAEFLEEHAAELAAPLDAEKAEYERLFATRCATPAELITLSRGLEISVGQKIKSNIRLSSGERQVEFIEEHSNNKGEPVIVPGLFMVSVPAVVDSAPVRIPARLRYRTSGGSVAWYYHLYRWQHWLTKAVQRDLADAVEQTSLPVFEGSPEA